MKKFDVSNRTIKIIFYVISTANYSNPSRLKNSPICSYLLFFLKQKQKTGFSPPNLKPLPSNLFGRPHLHPLPAITFLYSLFLIKQCPILNNKTAVRALMVMKPHTHKKKKSKITKIEYGST